MVERLAVEVVVGLAKALLERVDGARLLLEVEGGLGGVVEGFVAEPAGDGDAGLGRGERRQGGGGAADGGLAPVDLEGGLEELAEEAADAVVFAGEAGFDEAAHVAFAAGAGAEDVAGFLQQALHERAELGALLAVARGGVGGGGEDGAQAGAHAVEVGALADLAVETVEDAAFGGVEEGVVFVEQVIEDLAAVVLFADEGLAKLAVGLAVGVLDAAEVGAQAHGEAVEFADLLLGAGAVEDGELAGADLGEFGLEVGDLGFEAANAA